MRLITTALLFSLAPALGFGQESNGYLFVAPGQLHASGFSQTTLQVGLGGEYVIRNSGIGVGGEFSALGPTSDFSAVSELHLSTATIISPEPEDTVSTRSSQGGIQCSSGPDTWTLVTSAAA